jgi:hypothetical protein
VEVFDGQHLIALINNQGMGNSQLISAGDFCLDCFKDFRQFLVVRPQFTFMVGGLSPGGQQTKQ